MLGAYTAAAGINADLDKNELFMTEFGAGDMSGFTLSPGVYKWSSTMVINDDVTLQGLGDREDAVWIFQIAQTLTLASSKKVLLTQGAQAKNIFWQVAGAVVLGTGSHFEGTILAKTMIAMNTHVMINGRMLAQTVATLQMNTVTMVDNI